LLAPVYLRWQQAVPLQQAEPLQQPAFADFANDVPNVNINRAVRLRTPIIVFFIWILPIKSSTDSQMTLVTHIASPENSSRFGCF
jgi:hypothetical protein